MSEVLVSLALQGFASIEVVKKVETKDGNTAAPYPQFIMPLVNLIFKGQSDPFFAVLGYRNFKPEDMSLG